MINKIKNSSLIILVVLLATLALFTKTSLLAAIREWVLAAMLFLTIITFVYSSRLSSRFVKIFPLVSLILIVTIIASFGMNRFMFMNFQNDDLQTNKHLIVGYRNDQETRNLVKKNKVAGVYITARNIRGKTRNEIKNFIYELQAERKKYSENELVIMADQEGGLVSHLSPLLTKTPSLGSVTEFSEKGDEKLSEVLSGETKQRAQVLEIAGTHGSELQEIGINTNLAPIADLKSSNSAEGFSQISKRAISDNPEIAKLVIKEYCNKLWDHEVKCVLKHFPGIGDVSEDTHFELGIKKGNLETIKYQASAFESPQNPHFIMVSHSKIESVDSQNPASVSKEAIKLLKEINSEAKIVTDDFSMIPISGGIGVKKSYTKALEAGVDYILVSYDKELAYELW
ncbi:MAG: glycoside hydrolase family 3 N-terminal domain-containing protein [Patescibacteria group bacterium]